MKKLSIVCLFLFASSIYAVELKPSIGYGFLLNDIGTLGVNESQTKGGFNGNLCVMDDLTDTLSVGCEAGYMQIYKWNYTLASGWSSDLTYNTIPILATAEYRFGGNDTFAPYGLVDCGAFITDLKTDVTVAGVQSTTENTSTYFGAAVGAGAVINLKSFNIDFSVRYVFIDDNTSEKTRIVNTSIGSRFKL